MGDFSIFAVRIKELRTSLNMTQRDFAGFIGCTAATLSAYENGAKSPSLEIVKTIAQKCNVSIDWLCGLCDQKERSGTYTTYKDIVLTLFDLDDSVEIILEEKKISDYCTLTGIFFDDSILKSFLEEWRDATNVRYNTSINKTITQTMYDSWKNSKLEELQNKKLKKSKQKKS